MTRQKDSLSLPREPARLIFETDSFMTVPLLKTVDFVKYCKDLDLNVTADRVHRFEELGVFRPLVRFVRNGDSTEKLHVPNGTSSKWFEKGYLIDTYHPNAHYNIPRQDGEMSEAYFSIFQVDHLSRVLKSFTMTLHLDPLVGEKTAEEDWYSRATQCAEIAQHSMELWQADEFRQAIPVLCQYIANRYYPLTQTNQRTYTYSESGYSEDLWIVVNGFNWDWHEYVREFDPKEVEQRFALTRSILERAYREISNSANFCDPLEHWANLVEFVSLRQKKNLKAKALRALALRDAANMLRLLYRDLYAEDLRPSYEMSGQVITHCPELEIRDDVRHHLEFVANRYDLNPQPKLVLFVEGESEIILINAIFKDYFGVHPGVSGIELVNLRGVNNATGNRRTDRFQAIFRLVDYLHHHQTLTYLILDRENYAEKLKNAAKKAKSIHGQGRLAIPPSHIKLWKVSLEFDNFSDTEIAKGMTILADGNAKFRSADIKTLHQSNTPGKALCDLYESRTGYGLDKPNLSFHLATLLSDSQCRRNPENRPLVNILNQVRLLAVRNPFPNLQQTWLLNQRSPLLGGPRKP